ncbi:hypothetical protein ACFZB6_00695 [Streptomyces syringium]|uniref:hypothetical protein n=1 Tax=Streptomyces syringium TaxID=76729 RepID=UPI0036E2E87D
MSPDSTTDQLSPEEINDTIRAFLATRRGLLTRSERRMYERLLAAWHTADRRDRCGARV